MSPGFPTCGTHWVSYLRYSLTCARQMGSVIASTSFEDFEAMFDHEEFVRS